MMTVAQPDATAPSVAARLEGFFKLTKPRVVVLIGLTTAVGFLVGSGPVVNLGRLLLTVLGTALAGGGALALNQHLEREQDVHMERTRHRPLPTGALTPTEALAFGVTVSVLGLFVLGALVDPVAALVTAVTSALYLFLYTPLKRKSHLSTLLGAIPGALPPVTGWVAASGQLGPGAMALFGILFFWQLPHSLAIARLYREQYERAQFVLLPVVDKDGGSTGRQVMLNAIAMVGAGLVPTLVGIAGVAYAAISVLLGVLHAIAAGKFVLAQSTETARLLFIASLLYMPALLLALATDRIPL